MAPSDHEEDKKLLHDLVMKSVEAPEDWPMYPAEIVGRAGILKSFLIKIRLRHE